MTAALVSLAIVAAAPPTAAPELPNDPVLSQLIEQSLAARPEVAQAAALARAERERTPRVGALPDPMLQLGVQNDSFTTWNVGKMETSWYSIMASQTFPWPGKLRLRSEIAELGASQADQRLARLRLSTEAEVRRAYLSLMLAHDRLALLDRLDSLSRRAALVAQARYEAGTGSQADILRSQLEIKRIQQRRWALQVEATTARQTLNRLRVHPLDEPITPPETLADLPIPSLRGESASIQDAMARSPELVAARAGAVQGQRSVSLAKKSYFPDLTVSLGVMPRGGEFPPMWLASVGIPLPVFAASKQSREVAENEERLSAAQRDVEALGQTLRLRVEQRRAALVAALQTLQLYRQGLLAESEATAESTLAQYEVGKVTFVSVLEANAGLVTDQDSYLQVLAEAQRLQIDDAEVRLEATTVSEPAMGAPSMSSGTPMEAASPSAPASTQQAPAPMGGSSSGTGM